MKKKIFTLLTLLLCVCSMGGGAESVTILDTNFTKWKTGAAAPENSGLSDKNTYTLTDGTDDVASLVGKGCKLNDTSNTPTATGITGYNTNKFRFGSKDNYLTITPTAKFNNGGKVRILVSAEQTSESKVLGTVTISGVDGTIGSLHGWTAKATCDWQEFDIPASVNNTTASITITRTDNTMFIWGIVILTNSASPTHNVTVSYNGEGSYGTASAAASSVAEGGTTVVTAVPATGYKVTNWAVSGTGATISPSGTSNSLTTTLTMGTADATVTCTFGAAATYSVTHTLSNVTATSGATGASAATEGSDYTAIFAANTGYQLPDAITVTIGGAAKTVGTDYTWNQSTGTVTIPGEKVTGSVAITVTGAERTAPVSGTVYSLTVKSASYSVPKSTETNMVSDYATVVNGGAYIGNNDSSSDGKVQVKTDGSGTVFFNGNAGYIKLVLDWPIIKGDKVTFENGSGSNQICFTTAASRGTDYTTTSNTYTFGDTFNGVSTIYVWRTSTSSTYLHSLTITRFGISYSANTGSGTMAQTSNIVAACTFTAPDGKEFDHWNTAADDSGTTYAVGAVVTANTTLYAIWRDELPKYTVSVSVADGQSSYGEVSGGGTITQGEDATITATATDAAYKFQKWVIDSETEVTTNPYTIENVTAAHSAVAYFVARKTVTYSVTAVQKGSRTDVLTTAYADDNDHFTAPAVNQYLSSDNQTMTGWSNSGTPVDFGADMDLTGGNVTLTPVFANNSGATFAATLEASKSDFNVTWNFRASSANFNMEGTTGFYVQQATVNGETVDMPVAISTTTGKLNNVGRPDQWCQTNDGTTITIPVVTNSVITLKSHGDASSATINSESFTTTGTDGDYTSTYTYTGAAGTISIVAGGLSYISTLNVTYPSAFSAKPAIAAGTFSFEGKAYPVTITGAEGTTNIQTSTDGGANWTDNTTLTDYALTVNVTAGQTLQARAIQGTKTASEEVSFTNSYEAGKSYVAWVFESNYSGYSYAEDPMADAIDDNYNVVKVNTYTTDMSNADLIIVTEALDGKGDFMKSMKNFVGSTPMINLKFFAYTKGSGNNDRWNWGAPTNNAGYYTITPSSALYKVLDGVTFELDGSVKMFNDSPSGNVIQTVVWDAEPTDFPASNVNMGTTNSKVSMHSSNKFFGLGLSCDNKTNYSNNAITIVKNAAAMLIAGEALNTEMASVSGTISASGWNTFSSSYALDLNTITNGTAYVATAAANSKVTLTPTKAKVAGGTGLMIKGTTGDTFTIGVTSDDATYDGANLLVGLPNGGTVTANNNNYVFGWADAADPGFYFVNSTEPTLGAGKAYLHVDGGISAARLSIAFEDESTGIADVKALTDNESCYNLSGQKVSQPQKGLYIANGKKVIIK